MCGGERIIVVTDSSKFNRSSLHKIIDTQRIDMIIVDEGIPAESLEGLRKAWDDVVLVEEYCDPSIGEEV
jgi:DeoR family transcriptional regulator of aga operon